MGAEGGRVGGDKEGADAHDDHAHQPPHVRDRRRVAIPATQPPTTERQDLSIMILTLHPETLTLHPTTTPFTPDPSLQQH